jgi:HlyD family secretion protein
MPPEIFRKVSLDRLSSPEQIDQLLQVTTGRGWVALVALCGCIAAAVIWSVTSFTETTISGSGVTSRAQGVATVVSLGTGTVTDITVEVGDAVRASEVVAQVAQPALEQKLIQAKAELTDAERARAKIIAARAEGDKVKLAAMKQQTAGHEQDIVHTLEQVQYAKEQVPVDDQLVAKGLITKQTAIQDKQKVASLESNVAQLRVQIAQVAAQEVAMQNEAVQLALDHGNRINLLLRNVDIAEQAFRNASDVVAPGEGRVVAIISYQGAMVGAGQPILSYESTQQRLEVVAYVAADKAKGIRPGMQVHISPSGIEREEYGYMIGKVSAVGYFPATSEDVTHTFENEALARAMMSSGPVTEVLIDLVTSPVTRSGYQWSSPEGPPDSITSGAVSTVEIVTRAQHPIELVIPYLKGKLGLR